jgi:DNA replication protein DnaC
MSLDALKQRDAELAAARARLEAAEAKADENGLGDLATYFRRQAEAAITEPSAEMLERQKRRQEKLDAFKDRRWRDKVCAAAPVRAVRSAFDPKPTPAVQAVQRWLDGGCKKDLVLRGGVGTGKTTAACVAVKHWCEPKVFLDDAGNGQEESSSEPLTVLWLRPNALVSAIEHAYDQSAPKLRPFVVLDDLGRETRPEFVESFTELLDRDGHVLLITTNLTK